MAVTVTGLRDTVARISVEVAGLAVRAAAGLEAGGRLVRDTARANIGRGHHYEGRVEKVTSVAAPRIDPHRVSVDVGIQPGTFAPEGPTFEFGWASKSGKQPPTAPLAAWAIRRGLAHDEKQARRVGFAIARQMGRRGYSFGELHWLDDAVKQEAPAVVATVARFLS